MTRHLVFPILLPLAATTICLAIYPRRQLQRIAMLGSGAVLGIYLAAIFWPRLLAQGILSLNLGNWPAPYGITLAVDLLSGLLLTLTAIVSWAVLIYAKPWLTEREAPFFYPLVGVLWMGVNGAFLTGDVFNLYVFFEVMLVSSFALMALGGERGQLEGTLKYLAISQISSAFFLLGAGLIYGLAGTLNIADAAGKLATASPPPHAAIAALLFLVAFGIKAAVFPLHFWLPASYPTAKAPIVALAGGLLAEVGIYALYRVFTTLFPMPWVALRPLLLGISLCTMTVGVLSALAQSDLKRLLSFDIISQVGYLLLGLALGTPLALAAGIYFMIHIGVVKSSLFLIAGLAEQACGSSDLRSMGGLLHSHPGVATLFLVCAGALAGIPPLSGFYAKLGLTLAGIQSEEFIVVGVGLLVSLLTLLAMARVWTQAFMGRGSGSRQKVATVSAGATVALVAVVLLAAVLARPLMGLADRAAGQLLDPGAYVTQVLGERVEEGP